MDRIDWERLLRVPKWSRLDELPYEAAPVSGGLYKIGPHAYATAGPWREGWQPAIGELRVLSLLWACSDQAVLMLSGESPGGDDAFPSVLPPDALRLGKAATYADLCNAVRVRDGAVIEEEVGGPDGAFLYRVIRSSTTSYYLRNEIAVPLEVPFAVDWAMPTLG